MVPVPYDAVLVVTGLSAEAGVPHGEGAVVGEGQVRVVEDALIRVEDAQAQSAVLTVSDGLGEFDA
ncbi:hypothetical protein ACWD4O_41105 [Streptomyces sp. NPDC002623]